MSNQDSLKTLVETKLNSNPYGVVFNVDLFNTDDIKYYNTNTQGQKERFVPTMISDVVGEFINIPNANSTSNDVSISFDLLVDTTEELSDKDDTELENVGYTATRNAIEYFKNSLLAQYFPLGTPYLFMGGEDSEFEIDFASTISTRAMYFDITPYNTDNETILRQGSLEIQDVTKNATHIRFQYDTGLYIEIPYTINTNIKFAIYYDSTDWVITDGTNEDSAFKTYASTNAPDYTFGDTTGFEGLVKQVAIDDNAITSFDFDNVELETVDWLINVDTWDSKNAITSSGTITLLTSAISNSILWSEDGNAIFGFNTLNPVSNPRPVDGLYIYQEFELPMSVFISNDVLFGNNFEYYLDGIQVYPVDRQHTLGTQTGSAQRINDNYNEHIVEESSREHTMSFYYVPTKQLTSLLKHVVSGNTEQNTTYTLLVQYPFFQVSYDVILENGGTSPNINTLSSFTVTLKRKDASLT